MPRTTNYRPGDVALVNFVFSEETGTKRRPVVVLSSDAYHRGREEAIVAAVTSNVDRVLFGDTVVDAWREAGLLYPSVATAIVRTVKQEMLGKKLGTLAEGDRRRVARNLRAALGLD